MEQVRAKKHLGQHFLTDMGIASDIALSLKDPITRSTLEIGPGMGVLTQFIMQRADVDLEVVEIDTESVAYLRKHYPDLKIHSGDFLTMDLGAMYPMGANIVGNFPYNISSQIFFKVLDHLDTVDQVVCMLQKEVAVRIAEPPGKKDYGILSVFLQAYYDIEYLFTVDETVFNPPPKVKSGVVRLKRNSVKDLGCDERLFRKVVKATFNQRRKTIRNSLLSAFPMLEGTHQFYGARPETLSVAQFVELTKWVENNPGYKLQ